MTPLGALHPHLPLFFPSPLQEFTEYEVFVQPFSEPDGVAGLPSALKVVRTQQTRPSAPPVVRAARMLNATTAYVAWAKIAVEAHNGPLRGYQVRM